MRIGARSWVIKLGQDTITILGQHKAPAEQRCADLGTRLADDVFVFSYAPGHRRHCDPDAITHRYAKMATGLGIDTHLHALRHYSATELLAGGVDLRTVAGKARPRGRRSNHAQGLRRLARRPPLPGRPLPTTPAARPTTTKLRSVTATTDNTVSVTAAGMGRCARPDALL